MNAVPLTVALIALPAQMSGAVVLLGTNFDGRVLATTNSNNDTAGNLSWTLNGIADPGDL